MILARLWILVLFFGSVVSCFIANPPQIDFQYLPPQWSHLLGTDSLGQDYGLKIFQASFVSMYVGVGGAFLGIILGAVVGLASVMGNQIQRTIFLKLIELFTALPSFLVVSFVMAILLGQPQFQNAMLVLSITLVCIGITHWVLPARVARARALQLIQSGFIQAAKAMGCSRWHLIRYHMIPHLIQSMKAQLILSIPVCITFESMLSFIGFGPRIPWTSWGGLMKDSYQSLSTFPHLVLAPVVFLLLTVWSFYRLGKDQPPNFSSKNEAADRVM